MYLAHDIGRTDEMAGNSKNKKNIHTWNNFKTFGVECLPSIDNMTSAVYRGRKALNQTNKTLNQFDYRSVHIFPSKPRYN